MSEWQEMETAPRDGTAVLVSFWAWGQVGGERLYAVARYGRAGPHWRQDRWGVDGDALYDPTHWMPFAAPERTAS
jgi:hypothetical protein